MKNIVILLSIIIILNVLFSNLMHFIIYFIPGCDGKVEFSAAITLGFTVT